MMDPHFIYLPSIPSSRGLGKHISKSKFTPSKGISFIISNYRDGPSPLGQHLIINHQRRGPFEKLFVNAQREKGVGTSRSPLQSKAHASKILRGAHPCTCTSVRTSGWLRRPSKNNCSLKMCKNVEKSIKVFDDVCKFV